MASFAVRTITGVSPCLRISCKTSSPVIPGSIRSSSTSIHDSFSSHSAASVPENACPHVYPFWDSASFSRLLIFTSSSTISIFFIPFCLSLRTSLNFFLSHYFLTISHNYHLRYYFLTISCINLNALSFHLKILAPLLFFRQPLYHARTDHSDYRSGDHSAKPQHAKIIRHAR